MQNFKDLIVWQKSMALVTEVFRFTKDFPSEEKFGLINQMRRAAVSIPSNIAEGHVRNSRKVFKQFIAIARGSCAELETQNLISRSLGFVNETDFRKLEDQIIQVAKMLSAFNAQL